MMKFLSSKIILLGMVLCISCSTPFVKIPFTEEEKEMVKELEAEIKENSKDESNYQALGILYFERNYIDESLFYFNQVIKLNPKNAEAIAWLGSSKTKKGAELSGWYCFGMNKICAVKSGVQDLNQAVRMDPKNPIIRITRAATLIGLRGRFSDFEIANQDLSFLENNIKRDPKAYPEEIKSQILFYRASYILNKMEMEDEENLEKKNRAIKLIKKVIDVTPKGTISRKNMLEYFHKIKRGGGK